MPSAGPRPVRIGCSGWNYASWKDEFYEGKPARLWLQHYAQYFDTVEVNNTFYRLPLPTSVARWVEETPPNFVFAVKASRYLTHVRRLTDLDRTYVRFHYGSRGRRGNYSESELEDWARRFEDWRHRVEIYAYFNNDWEAFAIRNGLWLKKRLSL
jgi:uncharacterized protein YecE (DUF72 family)